MASGKLSPRQKMINMMYLVLIALLALNVSKEILKAFHLFELSFNSANKNTDQKNKDVMVQFEANMKDESKKVRTEQWYKLAKETQQITKEFNDYVQKTKLAIVTGAGGRKDGKEDEELVQPDNMEKHANYFVNQGNGLKIQQKIEETRKKLIKILDATATDKEGKANQISLEKTSQLRATDTKWVSENLEHSPLAGVVTFLTKTQNDAKSLEANILTALASKIDQTKLIFNKQMAVVISESTNVMSGSSYKADVALAAYNSTAASRILVNGSPIQVVDGIGKISIPASGVGSHKIVAQIESVDPQTGEKVLIDAPVVEWTSFQPSATISADAMNVLYIGLDNPMSISVPGVAPSATSVSPGAGLNLVKGNDGKYIAKITPGTREATISVSAKMPDGSTKPMGKQVYRIKNVPKPEAKLGPMSGGLQSKLAIAAQPTISAVLDNFVFDGVKFTITKYSVTYMPKRGNMEGPTAVSGNSAVKIAAYASKSRPGDMIALDGIRAIGPGGKEVVLNPLIFTIQ